MTRQEKIQFIAEDFANYGSYEEIIQDITQWTDEQLDTYLYQNYDHDCHLDRDDGCDCLIKKYD